MSLSIIILAAGQGKRMRSGLPKVMHSLAGRPLLEHVYFAASGLKYREIHVVYGHGGEQVRERLEHLKVNWVEQAEQLGTAHAVRLAINAVPKIDMVLILYGDVPLITTETLERLVTTAQESGFGLLTSIVDDPRDYGRIIRDNNGRVIRIVEEKDASEEVLAICEVNTGMMSVRADYLGAWLEKIESNNAQGEFYLTDIIQYAVEEGVEIKAINPDSPVEIQGINNRIQLAEMERYYQLIQAHQLMRQGVTLMDPSRFDLRGDLRAGRDITVDINVVFEGNVSVGSNTVIGPNCVIRNATIGGDVVILANCIIEDAVIGKRCRIGPFARIRPDTRLADDVHIGNFVELKKSQILSGTKINHLSYIGDSDIGNGVNIGAGTITCNYDGTKKHKTIIGDDVFVGSDTQLIAPVKIGDGATIGAGSTITRDVEPDALAISRTEQKNVKDWKKNKK